MSQTTTDQLREIIRRAKGYGYPLTEDEALARLTAILAAERLDELNSLWPKFTDIRSDGTNGLEDNPTARNYIMQRIEQLKKQAEA